LRALNNWTQQQFFEHPTFCEVTKSTKTSSDLKKINHQNELDLEVSSPKPLNGCWEPMRTEWRYLTATAMCPCQAHPVERQQITKA